MILKKHLLAAVAVLGFASQQGCVTQRAVESSVAAANAAMISPYLELPRAGMPGAHESGNSLEEAIRKMDAIIEQYPEQTVLANQLRVRQSMLLTVNRKDALARQRWSLVNRGDLKTERDRVFYDAREELMWAYRTIPDEVTGLPVEEATPHLVSISKLLEGVRTDDVKMFLHTVRMLVELKVVESMRQRNQAGDAAGRLAAALGTYVGAFGPNAEKMVASAGSGDQKLEMAISEFRQRVWLREIIRLCRSEAERRGYKPDWKPEWVGTVNLD